MLDGRETVGAIWITRSNIRKDAHCFRGHSSGGPQLIVSELQNQDGTQERHFISLVVEALSFINAEHVQTDKKGKVIAAMTIVQALNAEL